MDLSPEWWSEWWGCRFGAWHGKSGTPHLPKPETDIIFQMSLSFRCHSPQIRNLGFITVTELSGAEKKHRQRTYNYRKDWKAQLSTSTGTRMQLSDERDNMSLPRYPTVTLNSLTDTDCCICPFTSRVSRKKKEKKSACNLQFSQQWCWPKQSKSFPGTPKCICCIIIRRPVSGIGPSTSRQPNVP